MSYQKAATLADFAASKFKTIKGEDRAILLIKEGEKIFAVDNRCPHMGFPLNKGTCQDGILTCHWHHARFDASSGCAFDLFADDIPAYDVKVEGEDIFVSKNLRNPPSAAYYYQRLRQGLEQNISIIQYKNLVGLLRSGESIDAIATFIVDFASKNHEQWSDGLTLLTITRNLWDKLSKENQIFSLSKACRQIAENCAGQAARRERPALDDAAVAPETLNQWYRKWCQSRHRDGAERTLLTLIGQPESASLLSETVFGALHDRVYSDTGHNTDFANKAFELTATLGADSKPKLFPHIVTLTAWANGEEEKGGWRNPIDLIPIIQTAQEKLAAIYRNENINTDTGELRQLLLGENPQATVDAILDQVQSGTAPLAIAQEIAYVSALRLAYFPESNDIADWFLPVHTFTYSNAIYQSIARHESLATTRGLFHAALSVYQDRFLNVPKAPLPDPSEDLIASYQGNENAKKDLLAILDQKKSWRAFTSHTVAAYRANKSIDPIIDILAASVLREDFDFHKLQVVEAASVQARLWLGHPEAEHILAGAARHTAAHCPTPRGQSKMIQTAQALMRQDNLWEEED